MLIDSSHEESIKYNINLILKNIHLEIQIIRLKQYNVTKFYSDDVNNWLFHYLVDWFLVRETNQHEANLIKNIYISE